MGLPRDAKELLTPRAKPTGPFGHMADAVARALLPPPTPMGRPEREPVTHDAEHTLTAAQAKRQRRRERNRRLAGHG